MLTIGMFGTCGGSKWREPFIEKYEELGISYFNPQVDNWTDQNAIVEARHLAEDKVILFPITNETYATASLSEVGYSILNAIKLDSRRSIVVMVAQDLAPELDDLERRKDSLRARALNIEHLRKLYINDIYLVSTLEEMLDISIELYRAAEITVPLEKYNPHNIPRKES